MPKSLIQTLSAAFLIVGSMLSAHALPTSPSTPAHEQPRALPPSSSPMADAPMHANEWKGDRSQPMHHSAQHPAQAKKHVKHRKAHHRACGAKKYRSAKTGKCVLKARYRNNR